MKFSTRLLSALIAAPAAAAWPVAATAAHHLSQPANAVGYYFSDGGVQVNLAQSQMFPTSDGSNFQFVSCVGSEPGSPGCLVPGGVEPPAGAWYQLPNQPVSAAAQAWSPDYGISRARAWSRGTHGVGTGDPGYTAYTATANAGWREEITTTSLVPVVVTFVVSLHVDWNDSGVFAYQMGRPGSPDPENPTSTPMDGRTWTNCADCAFGFDTGGARTVLPGGADGSANLVVSVPFTVYPASYGDPEDPNPFTNPFEVILVAAAAANDAEVNAYSTATLLAIEVPPDAGLSFASGHAYPVQVVPEPATWALWAGGLAALGAWRRARR